MSAHDEHAAEQHPAEQHPADTDWHRWAPIGQTLDTSHVPGNGPVPSIAAFELLPLEQMLMPEKPRGGELDPSQCNHCKPSEYTIWQDDEWRVLSGFPGGVGLPFVGGIAPRRHVKLEDAPLEVLAGLGPIVAHALAAGGGEAFPNR